MRIINPKDPLPIYAQLIEQFHDEIALGRLKPGDQLPTVRQLAVDLRITPTTVARAYAELEREGLIITQQGRGSFVSERPFQKSKASPAEILSVAKRALADTAAIGASPIELLQALRDLINVD